MSMSIAPLAKLPSSAPQSPLLAQEAENVNLQRRNLSGASSFLTQHQLSLCSLAGISVLSKSRHLRRLSRKAVQSDGELPSRRGVLVTVGSLITTAPAWAEDVVVERAIPQARLSRDLVNSPVRTIVITGANSGVGLAGAKMLVAAGHHVICACRTQAKADQAANACLADPSLRKGSAEGMVCDLANLASVRSFVAALQKRKEKVDTLVLNAGLSLNATEKGSAFVQRTADGFEVTVGTNHLGHFLLANLMLSVLAAEHPRIVVTASPVHDPTSGGGNVGPAATLGDLSGLESPNFQMVDGGTFDPDKAYKDSKLCNMMFMAEAARQFASKGITVNAFSPGLIADPNGFFRNQNQVFATIFNQISKFAGVAETNEFGGAALAYLAVDPEVEGAQGGWYDSYPSGGHQLALHAASAEARDVSKQKKLWELSARLTKL